MPPRIAWAVDALELVPGLGEGALAPRSVDVALAVAVDVFWTSDARPEGVGVLGRTPGA